ARDRLAVAVGGLQDRLVAARLDRAAVQFEGHANSCGKYFIAHRNGLGAAWPSPQMDASTMTFVRSSSSGRSQSCRSINATAFAVPIRQGVHWPHDSSRKKRSMLSAASFALSLSESTMIAAEPMKHPYELSVSKSRGTSPRDAGKIPPEAPPGKYP